MTPNDEGEDSRTAMLSGMKEASGTPHGTQSVPSEAEQEMTPNDKESDLCTSTATTGRMKAVRKWLQETPIEPENSMMEGYSSPTKDNTSTPRLESINSLESAEAEESVIDNDDKIEFNSSQSISPTPETGEVKISARKNRKKKRKCEPLKLDPNIIPLSSSRMGKHLCKLCNKSFRDIYSAHIHLKNSCKQKEQIWSPNVIPSPSSTSRQDPHICKLCNKTFTSFYNAQRHVMYYCSKGERLPLPEDNSSLPSLDCAYCSYQCSNRQDVMHKHLVFHHPDMFFPPERKAFLSRWRDKQIFKRIVMELVIPKFVLRDGNSSASECSVCGKVYCKERDFSKNRCQLKVHLVNRHIQELRKCLQEVLEESDDSLKEKLEHLRQQQILNEEERIEKLKINAKKRKRKTPPPPRPPPILKEVKLTCKYCNRKFPRTNHTTRHERYNCPKGPKLPPPPGGGLKLTCAYCTYKCRNRQDHMIRHLVIRHPEMFFTSEKNSIPPDQRYKIREFTSILTELVFPKFIKTDEVSICCECEVCGKGFFKGNSFTLNRFATLKHLLTEHIENLREHAKEVIGLSNLELKEKFYDTLREKRISNFVRNVNTKEARLHTFAKLRNANSRNTEEGESNDVDLARTVTTAEDVDVDENCEGEHDDLEKGESSKDIALDIDDDENYECESEDEGEEVEKGESNELSRRDTDTVMDLDVEDDAVDENYEYEDDYEDEEVVDRGESNEDDLTWKDTAKDLDVVVDENYVNYEYEYEYA